jgi:hypothetical protein
MGIFTCKVIISSIKNYVSLFAADFFRRQFFQCLATFADGEFTFKQGLQMQKS